MNGQRPRSWASGILGFALMVLAACCAINLAARLLVAVLPVLAGLLIAGLGMLLALRLLRRY